MPGAPVTARFGALSFPQRFGSALNAHLHLHCCVTDGVFSEASGVLRFIRRTWRFRAFAAACCARPCAMAHHC
jgi:hypothetical protein